MTRLPSELLGIYSTSLPVHPNTYRVGAFDEDAHLEERIYCRTVLQGKLQLIKLQHLYTSAYLSTPNPTVHQWRDLLLSLAIYCLLRNSQTKDTTGVELTQHAKNFWASTYSADFLASISTSSNPSEESYSGGVGSVVFDVYQTQDLPQISPIELLDEIIRGFWSKHGVAVALNPAERHQLILDKLFTTTTDWHKVEDALNKVWYTPLSEQPLESRNVLGYLRRHLIAPSNWQNLKQRLIMGEIMPEVEEGIVKLQRARNISRDQFYGISRGDPKNVNALRQTRLQLGEPGGLAMYYLNFAGLGFLRAAKRITARTDVMSLSYNSFIEQSVHPVLKAQLARDLLLSYDAFGALGFFDHLKEAKGIAYRSYLMAAQLTKTVSDFTDPGNTRLYSFL